jgi:hypothetical protein
MKNRFEQLIEYVINDEEDKARALFHDIVVEKSRQIYEEMMDQEELDEAQDEELDEGQEEELDEAKEEEDEEELDEGMDVGDDAMGRMGPTNEMGGDAADDLMSDVEMEEEGMSEEEDDFADEEGMDDMDDGMGGEGDLEDRVVDLEDKLDELMAEFEALMGDEEGDEFGGDELEMDDTAEFGDDEGDMEFGGDEEEMGMMEGVSLKAAPKPSNSEEGGVNKKSPTAFNSGKTGMEGKPVHTGTSMGGKHDAAGAYSNKTKEDDAGNINKVGGNAGKAMKAAPKPVTSQASGVNNKSLF